MANFREIYKSLKAGIWYEKENHCVGIGTCDRWESPSYGKDYIYYQHYGSSATTVNFNDFVWIAQTIFGCKTANEFLEYFNEK